MKKFIKNLEAITAANVDNGYGIANEEAIRELVKREQKNDLHNMADYFDGSAAAKAKASMCTTSIWR